MSKLSSQEKFYIEKIGEGFLDTGKDLSKEKLLDLLSSKSPREEELYKEIKKSLDVIYIRETDFGKKEDIKEKYHFYAVKIYKGRETVLRDIIIKWYASNTVPNIFDSIKNIFK